MLRIVAVTATVALSLQHLLLAAQGGIVTQATASSSRSDALTRTGGAP